MRWFYTYILAFTIVPGAQAQTVADWINLGDEAMESNDPYGALRYYSEAFDLDSMKGSLIYRMAEAYRGVHNYPKASYYYDKIYRRDRGLVFKDVGMKLADMQASSGRYEEAKKTWRRVRKEHEDQPESYAYMKAVQSMRSCDLAGTWTEQNPSFALESASDPVSSGDSEFAGLWLDDGSLYFTSLRGEYDEAARLESEAYFIKNYCTDSTLKEVQVMTPDMDDLTPNYGNYARSESGMEAIVLINDSGHSRIFLKKDEVWQKLLPQTENDTSNYTHPSFKVLDDGVSLLFASDRPDGFGQYDLWEIDLREKGDPINLGREINSPGNEVTPFFRQGESSLFFSSDWHHGLGGYDIFRSTFFEGEYAYPENLRAPFSSPSNDLYYSFNENLKKGCITSNRVGPDAFGGCCNNLFYFEEEIMEESDTLPEIESLEDLNRYLPVTLYFHNDEPDPRTRKVDTEKDYLETYRDYIKLLPIYREEYRKGLDDREGDKAEDAMDAFFLNQIDKGVEDLAFFTELLTRELEEGAKIEVTVKGFASPLAATDYNVNLTQRRISSLDNYLRNYNRGILRPYLEGKSESGGLLRLAKVPFGEYTADEFVSDNPNESNAIYGIAAAKERKIEIVSVSRASTDTSLTQLRFEREIFNAGTVEMNDTLAFSFVVEVEGDQGFSVDSVSVPLSVNMVLNETYSPGSHEWNGEIMTGDQRGKQRLTLVVYGNIPGNRKELNITFEVQ